MVWYKRRIQLILWILCTLAFVLLTYPARAAEQGTEEGVRIVATESGSYDWDKQVFVARGEVVVTSGDLTLQGDMLTMDLASGDVFVQGNVRLSQAEQELQGDSLVFNVETGEGSLENARTEIAVTEDNGTIFISGETVRIEDEQYLVSSATFTTCDLEDSHFHLATKELEYYPGDKVIIRGVTYYEGTVPLFYWPYLVIPLDLDDWSAFTLPVFGFSEVEGYYMKNTFNYHFNSKAYGHLYVDLFTRLGVGIGARHFYDLGKLGKGSMYLYGIPTSDSPVLKSSFAHDWARGNWGLTTATDYENSWIKHELKTDNRLTLTLEKGSGEAWYKYTKNAKASTSEREEVGLRWTQDFTDQWRLNLKGSQVEQIRDEEGLRVIDYLAETIYRRGKHTVTLAAQQQYNPDLLEGEIPPWRSVQRIPELKWDVSDLGFKNLPLRSQVVVGHYGERPSTVTMNRVYGQLALGQKIWRPTTKTTASVQGHAATASYSDGQRQTWTYGRLVLNQRFTNSLQATATYSRRDVWGTTPFRFDRQNPLQTIDLRLNYTASPWRVVAGTSYNFLTKQFGTLTLQSYWQPNRSWNLSTTMSYNLNSKNLMQIVPMIEYKKDDLALKVGGRYQVQSRVLERVDARISLPVGETWAVKYDAIYEPPKAAFSKGTVMVSKDLHCRELSLSYDFVSKSVALQLTINAFPTLPIGWDSQGGLSLFDLEEVSDIIGVKE